MPLPECHRHVVISVFPVLKSLIIRYDKMVSHMIMGESFHIYCITRAYIDWLEYNGRV